MSKKVIIIGSGLGGLSCGVILAANGYDVTVLEQSQQAGGCMQCFSRGGARFETGMHFVGSAAEGQALNKLMRYLGVFDDVRLSPLNHEAYDIVALNGKQYKFANGRENFISQMSEYFPSQRPNLEKYFDIIEQIASASSLHTLNIDGSSQPFDSEYHLRSVDSVVESTISDPLLAKVLVGNLPLYAGERGKTSFATHAFIMDFYNQSSYRFVGGSDTMSDALVKKLYGHGGQVLTRHKATRILCNDSQAVGVEVNGGEFLPADYVISDAHPMRTIELIDSKLIRPAFRKRICSIPQTVGCFSVYLHFKDNAVPYLNSNYYAFSQPTPWGCEQYDETTWPKGFLYMHFCHEENPQFAKAGVILSYMHIGDLSRWAGTKVGRRGGDYEAFKQEKAERLLSSLEEHFPGIRQHIKAIYTSTPLTYLDYTGTESGSMYGIAKDVTMGAACRVPHKTKIPNVFQTGQNINSHGMLGVLVGTIVTCSEFLTTKTIYEQIYQSAGQ